MVAGVREPGSRVKPPYVYTAVGSTTLAFVRVPSGEPRRRLARKNDSGRRPSSQTKIHSRPWPELGNRSQRPYVYQGLCHLSQEEYLAFLPAFLPPLSLSLSPSPLPFSLLIPYHHTHVLSFPPFPGRDVFSLSSSVFAPRSDRKAESREERKDFKKSYLVPSCTSFERRIDR